VHSDKHFGRDLSSVQLLLNRLEAFDAGLSVFEQDVIHRITQFKVLYHSVVPDCRDWNF